MGRIPGLGIAVERYEAMDLIEPYHQRFLSESGLGSYPLVTAGQVHGTGIGLVKKANLSPFAEMDGLLTEKRGITLGIYVADCAPVWIVARNGSIGALLHSGKKGTELGIVRHGIRALLDTGKVASSDLIVVVGPCIRPPCYEVDFASEIARQVREYGITEIHDDGICTACHPERYYSYRRERGLTGRMLATLTLLPDYVQIQPPEP